MNGELLNGGVENIPVIQRDDFPFTHGEYFDGFNLRSLRDPKTRVGIPDLSTALNVWYETGDLSLIQSRCFLMARSHLAPVFVMNAYGFIGDFRLPNGEKRPFMIINHDPSFSAGENAEALAKQTEVIYQTLGVNELPQVLKTVTLVFSHQGINYATLVSGIGDFKLDRKTKVDIGSELGLPKSVSRTTIVNPPDFDTTLFLGLQPGMVKPILEPHLVGNMQGICYLRGRARPGDFVVVSVSHIDSMIMQVGDFEYLFGNYAKDNYIDFGLVSRPQYDFYKNNRTI